MKRRRFLATIAMILALLIACSSTSVAMESAADYVHEIVTEETDAKQDVFEYPEKADIAGSDENTDTETELRLPDVSNTEDQDETEYGEPIEVAEHTKTYQTGDRQFKTVYSEIPNTYENFFGKEVEYDNTLVLEEKVFSSDYYTAASSDIKVKLPAEVKSDFDISFEYDNVKIKLSPLEGDYSKSATKENAILYNDVFDGIDVQYTVNALGMKEDIILNKCVDKNTFVYKLDVSGAKVVAENGVLNLYKDDSSVPALTISAPIMTDANGSISDDVTLSLEDDVLTITADKEWINAPERVYPIKIDPNVTVPASKLDVVTVSEHHGRYAAKAYGYVGDLTASQIGVPGSKDLGKTRLYFSIKDDFSGIPEGSKIKSAVLRIYQYTNINSSTQIGCYRVEDAYNINTIDFEKAITLNESIAGENSISTSHVGFHEFDIRQTVNDWIQGIAENYGLSVKALDESMPAGAFFTPYSSSSNGGQGSFTADKAPQIIIDWEVPNPVDPNYPLNNTTINLRTIIENNKDGKLKFHGIFADGVAQPGSTVNYKLNDSSLNKDGTTTASPSYKYPDSTSFNQYFPARATKYKDIQSNWQTNVPFTNPKFDTIYYYSATATKDGATGNTAKSDEFLIYKVKQFDVLSKIANYYGVPLSQISFDNRVQDMLLVENNTIIIRNPTKNGNRPYNPEPLTDADKRKIDSLLVGRGKHCEFGFEPINLNTGNFYMNQTDVSIPDYNGDFSIERTYNSKTAGYNSIFGRGWQFAYSESLSKTSNGEYVYSRGDGSALYFEPDGKGGYSCPAGYYMEFTPVKVATKEGDFGGDELESYDVYEYEIKDASGTIKRFNYMGLLVKITDSKGFVTTLTYDDNYNLSAIKSPAGTTYALSYTADGYVNAITMPNGKQLTYAYDENNNLVSFTDGAGNKTTYAYDEKHQMTSWSDGNGDVVNANVYDDEGRVIKQTDGNGNVTTLLYEANMTTTTDANGNVTVYHYDDNYRTTKIVYADGSTEENIYDSGNNLAAVIDRNGNRTEYTYDANGNVVKETRYDGAVKTYSYNSDNQLVKTVDFNGAETVYTYSNKDLTSIKYANGTTVKYEYDSHHRIVKETDANKNVTKFEYTGAWLSSTINPNGGINHYYYNSHGQVVSIVDALGQTTRFVYDSAGRKTQQQTADGAITKFSYDPAGNTVSITDANGNVFTFEYDANGNVTKATDPFKNETLYTYDGLNNRLTETDPSGKTTTYSYDCFSNVSTVTNADGKTTTYEYDHANNLIKIIEPKGNTTTLDYDLRFNTVSKITDAENGIQSYTFDEVGNIVKVVATDATATEYVYDSMNRVVSTTDAAGLKTTYTYDANDNLIKTEDNTGRTTSYTYDNMDNVLSVVLPNGAVLSYEYDLLGRQITSTDALGGKTTYSYNALSQLVSSTDELNRTIKYEYDAMGNMLRYIAANEGVMSYEYDSLDRVTKVTDVLGNYSAYTYDKSENLASLTDVYGNATTYEYNGRNLVTKVKDALGNAYTFVYDDNGNQTEIIAPDGTKTVMEYDGLNRLVKTTDAAGLVTTYEYNELNQLIAERNNAGKADLFSYDDAGRVNTITNAINQTVVYTYDQRGNITSIKTEDGNTTRYSYDLVGNVISSSDAEGKVTNYTYDLNGNLLSKEDYAQRVWHYYYDAANRLTSEKNPLDEVTSYEYNASDFVTKITDAKGIATIKEYDLAGNLLAITDGNGNKETYEYDDLYRLVSATAADGGKQEYLYDAVSNLIRYKDALGNVTLYVYDSMNRTKEMTKPTGGVYKYGYDAHGNQTSITDPLNNSTSFAYDLNNNLTKKTLANGAEYTYAYDAIGRIVKQTAPEGLSRTYAYDEAGNLASETDQSNRTTTYAYDQMHRLISSTNPASATTNFRYDERGNLTSVITPMGYTTTYEYDVLDRITKSLDPTGKMSEMYYDAVGNLEKVVENGGRVYTYTYDNVGNLTSITNPLEQTQNYVYDSVNRLIKETDLAGNTQAYTYDYNGQTKTITNKIGGVSSFEYDGNGNLISATDAENRKVEYTYDLADRLISVKEADAIVAEYQYDSVGNMVAYTNGNGKVTKYTYNQLGDMTSLTDPLGNVKEFSYNVNAMLDTITNPDDSTVHYDYDVLDQLISKSYDDEDEAQALYGYDADGNRISMEDVAGFTGYEYDGVGKITAVNLTSGKKILYTYDEFGNLAKLTYPDGTCVTYTYNVLDQLTEIKDRQGKITSYERDSNGNVTKVTRPNGTYTTIKYNEIGAISEIVNMGRKIFCATPMLSKFEYTYDQSGLIKSEVATSGNMVETNLYAYDNRGQLVSSSTIVKAGCAVLSSTDISYTYDNNGNRTQEVVSVCGREATSTKYTYNASDQLIREVEATGNFLWKKYVVTTHEYDENGNLVKTNDAKTRAITTYTYDNENRLKAVRENCTLLMAALYDGDGQRIFRLDYKKNPSYTSNRSGTATNIYFDCASSCGISYDHNMIEDEMLIPNGVNLFKACNYELTGYINDINAEYTQVLMEYGANQRITNVYEYGEQRNSATMNGTKGYYMYDGRGSVASMTGICGQYMVSYDYGAYGETIKSNTLVNNPYQYNAEYTDASTGLQYLRARYYDSSSGRFLTQDTYLGETNDPLSMNRYIYTRNNPVNLVDPSGHLFGLIIGIVVVATAAISTAVSVHNHNKQTSQIRSQQQSYESRAKVQNNVTTEPKNLKAPTSYNDKGSFSYYNAKDKKVVTFTEAADYFEYKKLCEELDKLDKNLALDITHNALDAIGVIPGFGEVADAINGTIYLAEGDYVNAGLSFVSCIPLAGDAVGKGGKVAGTTLDIASDTVKYADDVGDALKYADDISDATGDLLKHGDDVADASKDLFNKGYTLDANQRWHRPDGTFASNAEVGKAPSAPKTPSNSSSSDIPIYKRGDSGQQQLEKMYEGQSQVSMDTSNGQRIIDRLDANNIAHESKVGYTSATDFVKKQIDKDVELITEKSVKGAHWHFYESPATGKTGPSQPLIDYLEEAKRSTNGKFTYTIGE